MSWQEQVDVEIEHTRKCTLANVKCVNAPSDMAVHLFTSLYTDMAVQTQS